MKPPHEQEVNDNAIMNMAIIFETEWQNFMAKGNKTETELELLQVCNRSGKNPYELIELLQECGFLPSYKIEYSGGQTTAKSLIKYCGIWNDDDEDHDN